MSSVSFDFIKKFKITLSEPSEGSKGIQKNRLNRECGRKNNIVNKNSYDVFAQRNNFHESILMFNILSSRYLQSSNGLERELTNLNAIKGKFYAKNTSGEVWRYTERKPNILSSD